MKILLLLFTYGVAALPLFADDLMPQGMTSLMQNIAGIFTGDFVKFLLIACLSACAVAYGFNRDNEKIKRNCIAIGIAIAILMTASFIVEKFMTAAKSN